MNINRAIKFTRNGTFLSLGGLTLYYVILVIAAISLYESYEEVLSTTPCIKNGNEFVLSRDITLCREPTTSTRYMGEDYEYRTATFQKGDRIKISSNNPFHNKSCYSWHMRKSTFKYTWVKIIPWDSDGAEVFVTDGSYGCMKLRELVHVYQDYIIQNELEDAFHKETGCQFNLCSAYDAVLAERWENFLCGKENLKLLPIPFIPRHIVAQLALFVLFVGLIISFAICNGVLRFHLRNERLRQIAAEKSVDWTRKFENKSYGDKL